MQSKGRTSGGKRPDFTWYFQQRKERMNWPLCWTDGEPNIPSYVQATFAEYSTHHSYTDESELANKVDSGIYFAEQTSGNPSKTFRVLRYRKSWWDSWSIYEYVCIYMSTARRQSSRIILRQKISLETEKQSRKTLTYCTISTLEDFLA